MLRSVLVLSAGVSTSRYLSLTSSRKASGRLSLSTSEVARRPGRSRALRAARRTTRLGAVGS